MRVGPMSTLPVPFSAEDSARCADELACVNAALELAVILLGLAEAVRVAVGIESARNVELGSNCDAVVRGTRANCR